MRTVSRIVPAGVVLAILVIVVLAAASSPPAAVANPVGGDVNTYLPAIFYPLSKGIHGKVTFRGNGDAFVNLELRFYNGSTWSTTAETHTEPDGTYSFLYASSLGPGQLYYVRYINTDNPDRLFLWATATLSTYSAGSEAHIGDFDTDNIILNSPAPGATVGLPYTFTWAPRPSTPTDSYEFNLFDFNDGDPYFYTIPPLGYVGSYILNSLPAGFATGTEYVWDMWTYSPDGGYGISYWAYVVYFSSGEVSVETAAPAAGREKMADLLEHYAWRIRSADDTE